MKTAIRTSEVIMEAAKPFICPEIEELRSAVKTDERIWEPSQIKELCDRICMGQSLAELSARFERSEDDVMKCVISFGSWLSAAMGAGESDLASPDSEEQLPLFSMPSESDPSVIVHDSLRPRPRRNEGAIKAITWHRPSLEVIKTYRIRQDNSGASDVLTGSTVTVIAEFARLGRLADVAKVNPEDVAFSSVICDGFDVLEVYRQDGLTALLALAGFRQDPIGMANAVRKAAVLFPQEAEMMNKALATGNQLLINKASGYISRRLENDSQAYSLTGPHSLSIAQVLAICAEHGLSGESDKSVSDKAKDLLGDYGLAGESYLLMKPAMAAVEAGTEDAFLRSLGIET